MSTNNESEYTRRIYDFLNQHPESYTEAETRRIKLIAARNPRNKYVTDLIAQISDEIEMLPDDLNIYQGFLNILDNNFDIDRDIIEVGGGVIPSLAKKIALKQKKGTITVYDPRLMPNLRSKDNLRLKRQMFGKRTSIHDAKMIISLMPCDSTHLILEVARQHGIDFAIGLCEGGTRRGFEYIETEEEWISCVKYMAERAVRDGNLGTLETASLKEYGSNYPVIYNKRK